MSAGERTYQPGEFIDAPLRNYLAQLASETPTPGGGSCAALVAALAAGLGEMVAAFTVGRAKFAAVEPDVRIIREHLGQAREMLQRLIDQDAEAYAGLSAAFKLDRTDPLRGGKIQSAAAIAAGVPFQTAVLARRVGSDLQTLQSIANPNLITDVKAGLAFAQAAFSAAIANTQANLPYMESRDAERMRGELRAIGVG